MMSVLRIVPLFLLGMSLAGPSAGICARSRRRPFTVADSIESTQVLYDQEQNDPALISPDGKKFVVILQHGDLRRNGSWVEFLVGSTQSLQAASQFHVIGRLFSKSTARASDLIQDVRWLRDNQTLTFLWDNGEASPRVMSVNTVSGKTETLVQHSTPIAKYDIRQDGRTIIFLAQSPRNELKEAELERRGFAVTDQPLSSILRGSFDGWTAGTHYETYIMSRPGEEPRKIQEPNSVWSTPPELLQLSPDARYALLVRPAREIPPSWNAYTEHVFKDIYLPAAREHPMAPNYIRQYFILDLKKAIVRPLWSAPENPVGDAIWSPDSQRVAIGPTFVPTGECDSRGLSGRAVAVIDVVSGRFDCLPVANSLGSYYRPVRWLDSDVIEITTVTEGGRNSSDTLRFKKKGAEWKEFQQEYRPIRGSSSIRFELRQGLNTSPALYAVNENGVGRLVRNLNPKLGIEVTLGRVETVHWDATDGRSWTGTLYYPVHHHGEQTFPLVIQTHGFSEKQFSLDGSFTTAFAAQELANEDIAVLQTGGPDSGLDDIVGTPAEPRVYSSGFEGAIEHFVHLGLADPRKVGIIGFSRTGWFVEYMLSHSSVPIAAAEVADNVDGSYVQYVMDSDRNRAFDEKGNGARPFGKGLETWSRMAPGFNADRVRAPLRMEVDSGPIDEILGAWEMFRNLRYLHKPVELFVIPDIQHGVHVLQNPRQRLASQGGTVDWFCFWLKGQEDPDPHKKDQYVRWHQLRNMLN